MQWHASRDLKRAEGNHGMLPAEMIDDDPRSFRQYHSRGDSDNHPLIPRQGRTSFIRDSQYNIRSFQLLDSWNRYGNPDARWGSDSTLASRQCCLGSSQQPQKVKKS